MNSFKTVLLSFIVLGLSACGFTPMYGSSSPDKQTAVKTELNQIDIEIIPDRSGQYLRNALIDRFYYSGLPSSPHYNLSVDPIKENISNFDLTLESAATRRQLKLVTKMILRDAETNKILLTRTLEAYTSHNVLESEFSTLVTEQSAREAALDDLARQVERQLALYFSR